MQFSALLQDVVSALSVISLVFQRKDGTATDIHQTLTNVLSVLDKYKTKDGPYLAKFKSGALCQEATAIPVQFPSSKSNLLTSLEDNLKKGSPTLILGLSKLPLLWILLYGHQKTRRINSAIKRLPIL